VFLNILRFGLSEGLAKLVPVVTVLVLAKSISKDELGLLSLLVVLVEVSYIFVSNNIQATTRIDYFKLSNFDFVEKSKVKLIISLLIWLLLALAFSGAVFLLDLDIIYLLLLPLPILKTYVQLNLAIYQCSKQTNRYLLSQTVFVTSYITFFSLSYFNGYGLSSWVVSILLGSFAQFVFCLFNGVKLSKYTNVAALNSSWGFILVAVQGIKFLPQAIGWWLKSASERYIIGLAYGLSLLGVYSFSSQFSFLLTFLVTAINLAILPEVNKNIKNGSEDRVNRIYLVSSLVLSLFSVFLIVLSLIFIEVFYSEYVEGSKLVVITIMSTLLQSLYMLFSNEVYFRGGESFIAKWTMLILLSQAITFYAFTFIFSLETALLINIASNVTLLFLTLNKIVIQRATDRL
jgi:O-antigen/teichoic acid export membrane protein